MKTSADKEVQFYTRAAPSWERVVHCSSPYIMAEMLYICSPCQHPRAAGGISVYVCRKYRERWEGGRRRGNRKRGREKGRREGGRENAMTPKQLNPGII